MFKLIALALLQIASFAFVSTPTVSSPSNEKVSVQGIAEHGSGGWIGVAEHGSGGWIGVAEHGSGGWIGVAEHGSGGWIGVAEHGNGGWIG